MAEMPLFKSTGVGEKAESVIGDGFEPPIRTARGGRRNQNYAVAASGMGSAFATLGAGASVTILGVSTAAF